MRANCRQNTSTSFCPFCGWKWALFSVVQMTWMLNAGGWRREGQHPCESRFKGTFHVLISLPIRNFWAGMGKKIRMDGERGRDDGGSASQRRTARSLGGAPDRPPKSKRNFPSALTFLGFFFSPFPSYTSLAGTHSILLPSLSQKRRAY